MLVWTVLLFLFLVLDEGSCSLSVREYDILAYRNINNAVPLATYEADSLVIDIVYGVMNVCSTSSQKDFLVITTDQVYYYDDIYQMTSWSCKQESYDSAFPDYTDLPQQSEVVGVLKHQSNVELYTDSKVFRWQIQSDGTLTKAAFSVETISAHLDPALPNAFSTQGSPMLWAAQRARSSVERHFYFSGDSFVLFSEQWGIYSYTRSDVVNDQNGFNMNPWSDIPSDTIALAGYTDQSNINFALVTSNGTVYSYVLNHGINNNNPPKTRTEIGMIYLP